MSVNEDSHVLTSFECEAFRRAIDAIHEPKYHAALSRQFEALRIREREYTGVGFISYCQCPPELRSDEIPDTGDGELPVLDLYHPNGRISLQFIVRVEEGAIVLLDGMSMGAPWSEEEVVVGVWPEVGGSIAFDPALMKMPPPTPEQIEESLRRRDPALLPIEREGARHTAAAVKIDSRRAALLGQIESLRVRTRTYSGIGFFTYFDPCPPELRIMESYEAGKADPACFRLLHPDGKRWIDFQSLVLEGAVMDLLATASEDWSENDIRAGVWPGTREPIVFDPALIRPWL